VVTVHGGGAAVAQVGGEGGARRRGIMDTLGGGAGVPDPDGDAVGHQVLDQGESARHFRRQGHQFDTSGSGVLPAFEIFDRSGGDKGERVGAARAIVGRNIRALHVQSGDHGIGGSHDGLGARGEVGGARRDHRRQTLGDAGLAHRREGLCERLRGQGGRIVVNAGEAIDVEIDQSREAIIHASTTWSLRYSGESRDAAA
jgi:hypothetical protein